MNSTAETESHAGPLGGHFTFLYGQSNTERTKPMNERQIQHYADKLQFETDAWDLRTALEHGEPIIVVDARSSDAYEAEHIPGAINLPHRTMTPETTAHLDPEALIVTYCDGIGCNASTKGALNLSRLGFRVKELMGGLDWWKRDGYSTAGKSARERADNVCGCGPNE